MPNQSDPDTELTPEAAAVLDVIHEDTKELRRLDLTDTPPAIVFEADGS